jgi:diguanylate cyclase
MLQLQCDTPVLMSLFDPSDWLHSANAAFRSAYGLTDGEGLTWADIIRRNHASRVGALVQTDDLEAWLACVGARRRSVPFRAFEADLCDGRWLWMTETLDAEGWMLCVASDISSLKASERGLRLARDGALRAAQTDALTGVSSRAHLFAQLERVLVGQHQQARSSGVVMLDLDHFKSVNDSFGHAAGDAVLQQFARGVATALRPGDVFGRVGGEEFMLVLPGIGAPALQERVEHLLAQVRQARPLPEHPGFGYTCSAGLVMLAPGMGTDQAYRLADQALYVAKRQGRDRLAWAQLAAVD